MISFLFFSRSNRIDQKKFFFQKDQSFLTFHTVGLLYPSVFLTFFFSWTKKAKEFFLSAVWSEKKKKPHWIVQRYGPAPFISRSTLIHIRHTRYYVDDNGPRINIHAGDAHKCYRCILHIAYAILCSLCLPACLPALHVHRRFETRRRSGLGILAYFRVYDFDDPTICVWK